MSIPDLTRIPERNALVIHGILLGFLSTPDAADLAAGFQLEADDERITRIYRIGSAR